MNQTNTPHAPQVPVRFGLVGYGLFGAHHARAIERTPGAELRAIAVPSAASREAAAAAHPGVPVFEDYRELLALAEIDLVSVVVPNWLHHRVGRDVLSAGKHLLLEKPMGLTLGECDELIRIADANRRVLAVGHELRLSSLWGGAKQLIAEGAIGEPQHVLVELSRFPYRQGSQGWRYDHQNVGSWILEEPIHFFDLAAWYLESCGEPISVYARANSRDRPELRDNFSAIVNFPRGAYAVVSQTLAAFGHHQTAKIAGTKGAIWAWWSAADARSDRPTFGLRYGIGNDISEMSFGKPAGELLELADEIAAMVACVRHGESPPCTGRDGQRATLLCLASEQSIQSGGVVQLDQFQETAARLRPTKV